MQVCGVNGLVVYTTLTCVGLSELHMSSLFWNKLVSVYLPLLLYVLLPLSLSLFLKKVIFPFSK